MKYLCELLICFVFMTSSCENQDNCHAYISFENQSGKELMFSLRYKDLDGNCVLNGEKVMVSEIFRFRPYNSCIEDHLKKGVLLDIYLIENVKYNNPSVFYNCDSIAFKNDVLKQYSLTLEDLKQNDFTITYP